MRVLLPTYFSLFLFILLFGTGNTTSLFAQYPTDFTASQTTICEGDVVEFTPVGYDPNVLIGFEYPNTYPAGIQYLQDNSYMASNFSATTVPASDNNGAGQAIYNNIGTFDVNLKNLITNSVVNKPNFITVNPRPPNTYPTVNTSYPTGWVSVSTTGVANATLGTPLDIKIDNQNNKYGLFENNVYGSTSKVLELIKYNETNQAIWSKIISYTLLSSSTHQNRVLDMSVDNRTGNIYLSFVFHNQIDFGQGFNLTTVGQGRCIVKYNTNGTVIWAKKFESANTGAVSIDVINDNLIMAGNSSGTESIDGTTLISTTGFFVAKLNSQGNIIWTTTNTGEIQDLAVSSNGNIIVGVSNFNSVAGVFNGFNVPNFPSYLVKYNSLGTTIWAKKINSYNNQDNSPKPLEIINIEIDTQENIYFTGRYNGKIKYEGELLSSLLIEDNQHSLPYDGNKSYIIKVAANGQKLWSNLYDLSTYIHSLQLDNFDNPYFYLLDFYGLSFVFPTNIQRDDFIIKLNKQTGKTAFEINVPFGGNYFVIDDKQDITLATLVQVSGGTTFIGQNIPLNTSIIANYKANLGTFPANFTLQAEAPTAGQTLTYQWIKDGQDISGATSATFTPTQEGFYQLRATNQFGCSSTNYGVYLQVETIDFTANTTEICEDESVTFTPTIVPNPSQFQNITWNFDGQDINASYNPLNYVFEDAGVYSPSLTYQNDNVTRTDYVTVNPNPVSSLQNNPWEWVHTNSKAPTISLGDGYRTNITNADIDSKGNLYVGGQWTEGQYLEETSPFLRVFPPNVTKIDKQGNVQWKIPNAAQVAIDDFDNVFAVGQFTNTITLPSNGCAGITLTPNTYSHSWFVVKYSSSGELLWSNVIETDNASANFLLATGGNKLYILGQFWQADNILATSTNGSNQTLARGNNSTFLAEYNPSNGELHQNLHTFSTLHFSMGGTHNDAKKRGISVDYDGNLVITALTGRTVNYDGNVVLDNSTLSIYDNVLSLIKYKNDAVIFTKAIYLENGFANWLPSRHVTDGEGNIYWTFFALAGSNVSWNILGQSYSKVTSNYLIKLNPNGGLVWIKPVGVSFIDGFETDNNQLFVFSGGSIHFYDTQNGLPLRKPIPILPTGSYSNIEDVIAAKNGVLYVGGMVASSFPPYSIGSNTVTDTRTSNNYYFGLIAKYNYNQTLPQNGSIDLQATLQTGAPSVSYQWYKDGNIINGATSSLYSANQIGFYQVETTTTQGCSRRSVGQYLSEPATFSVSDNDVCVGEPIILETTDLLGTNTEWNFGLDASPNLVNAFSNREGTITQNGSFLNAGTKTVSYQDGTFSLDETVTVRPLPNGSIFSTTPQNWNFTNSFSSVATGHNFQNILATAYQKNTFRALNRATNSVFLKMNAKEQNKFLFTLDNINITDIKNDKQGNIYLIGKALSNSVTLTGRSQVISINATTGDRFLIKYNENGDLIWNTKFVLFTDNDNIFLTANQDNIYLIAKSGGSFFGTNNNSISINDDFALIKYNTDGTVNWSKEIKSSVYSQHINSTLAGSQTNDNSIRSFETDENGNLFFSLIAADSVTISGVSSVPPCIRSYDNQDWTNRGLRMGNLLKLDANGNIIFHEGLSLVNDLKFTLDNQNNLIASFQTVGEVYSLLNNQKIISHQKFDINSTANQQKLETIVIKYDNNGQILWNKNLGTKEGLKPRTIAVDKANNPHILFNQVTSNGVFNGNGIAFDATQTNILALDNSLGNVIKSIPFANNLESDKENIVFDGLNRIFLSTQNNSLNTSSITNYFASFGNNTCIDEGRTISIQNTQPNTTYTWFKDGIDTGNNGTSITIIEEGTYHVEAENQYGCRQSSTGTHFSIFPEVQILPQQNPVIGYGSAVIGALATPLGRDYEYQWQFNGVDIPNATSPILIANESGNYQVKVVSEDACEVISDVKEVQIRTRNGRATIINDNLTLVSDRASSATSTFSEGLDVDVNGAFIFEGGVFSNNLTFGSNSLTSRGLRDGYLVKRDTTGNILWNRSWGSSGDDQTNSIATTTEGEAIVGGLFNQTATIGDTTLISKGQTDGILAKYAANGDFLWAVSTAGEQNDQITSVATDLGGHAIAAGFTTNTATVSTLRTDTTFTQTGENAFVVRYQPNGKLLWANQLISPVSAKSTTVATDIFGDVFVAGSFKTSLDATDENGTTLNLNGTTAELGFVAKYDEYGRLLWLKSLPKAAKGIDTDDFGNVFIVGQEFLYSFLPNGQSRFEEIFPSNASVSNIAVGRSGKIAISGHFTGTLNGSAATGNEEGFVSYFLPNGTLLDTKTQGGTQNDRINGVSFDELGNLYTTGFYENAMTISTLDNSISLSNTGRAAVFTRFQPVLMGCGLDVLAQNHTSTDFDWTQNGQNLGNGTTLSFSNGNAFLVLDATENSFTTQDGVRIQTQTAFTDLGEDQNSCQIITLDAGNNEGNGFARFEWYKDNVLITGEENQALEVDESGTYKIIAFTSQNCQATDEVNLTVAPLEVLMNIQNDTLVCEGSLIELRGFGADSYTYFKNNNPIGTGNFLTVLDAQNGDSFYVEGTRTSDNCINSSIPITISTKSIPQIDLGLNDQYFCPNDTLQLTANLNPSNTSNQYVFDWYRIEPNQTAGTRVGNGRETLNVTQTGKYFVIISNSDNNVSCSRTSDTVTVNAYDLPVVLVEDVHVCDTAQSARLSASDISHGNMISYEWKNLNTGQNVGSDSILFVTNEDFYQVKVTNTSTGCSVLDTAKAFFHTTPNFEILGYENPLCDRNDTLFIEATNLQDYSVEWFGNGIVSTVSTTQNQSIVINRSGIYTVVVTDTETGCSTTKTQEVIINQIPILGSLPQSSIQNPLVACQGDSVVLDAFDATHEPNATYEWVRLSNRNAATQTLSTSSKLTLTYEETLGLMPFAYQVKVSYPTTNCFITDTVFVQFKRKSNVIATSNKTQICLGEEVNFEATGATSYRWNDGNINAIRTVQPDSVGTWTYIVEGKYDNDCNSSFDTIIVKVNPIPVAEIEEESIILCQNENLELNGFLPQHSATSRYIWTHIENNQVLSTDAEINLSFNQVLPISYEPFTLRLTVFDSLTNCESSDEVTVKFNRSSNVEITENYASKICINEEITFTATGATSYSWRKLNDTSNVVLDSTNQVTVRLDSAGFHTFIVEGSYQNGCNSTFDTVSVFVNPASQVKAHTADSVNICAGNSILLSPSGWREYEWIHDPTVTEPISVSPMKSTTYYVFGTDENGCHNVDSVFVYVTPTFELPNLIQLCEGETITIGDTLSSDLNAVYEWTPTKDKTPFIEVSKSGIYTVKVNVENCEFERSVEVQIKENPVIELVADTVLCFEAGAEDRFERNLSHTLGSVITNYDSSATYLYVWTDENEQIIATKPNLEINEGGNYRLRVVARYGNNCEATDSVLATELCEPRIFIPEAFTPNNDNLNDYFEVFGKHAIDFEMQIFDRWGQVMYQINTSNIEDVEQEDFWDGTYKGKQVPTGAYVWIIRYSSPIDKTAKQTQKTGSFMIIR
ncbi:gliding motility-associated C-terminal domain-containing protein [Bernardetia sp. OM2101]|uniref:T9SS type B sorting domain-containing protein n=1 Tax=Bernardetia sp. OM2101 TaxID=3344876 RepID=UPI0035D0286B